ncbi:hypothetical protein QFC19_008611 [Naganishia cerealis]|uniref:Uncharacterized protein n=1 Tax=Naganishia cerealis TaxID=610337 RepID=A0ACC2V169_9TREE|nr:hypothetical protein QFC19_008611 [Naganishia cerealis]
MCAVCILNATNYYQPKQKSVMEIAWGRKRALNKVQKFGSYGWIRAEKRAKSDWTVPKAVKGRLLGWHPGGDGYIMLPEGSETSTVSSDVVFIKDNEGTHNYHPISTPNNDIQPTSGSPAVNHPISNTEEPNQPIPKDASNNLNITREITAALMRQVRFVESSYLIQRRTRKRKRLHRCKRI